MNLSDGVFELAEEFMNDPKHVVMNRPAVDKVAKVIKKSEKPSTSSFHIPEDTIDKEILAELIANSINYCYWYGRPEVRPNGSSSSALYNLVHDAIISYPEVPLKACIQKLILNLTVHRFPLLEERIKHLRQLTRRRSNTEEFINLIQLKGTTTDIIMSQLITRYPGYAADLFLKRTSLFVIQLFRRFRWYCDELRYIHIPADYHIPKILNHLGCIDYSAKLFRKISYNELIYKGSIEECEIRAATILVAKKLCELTGWNVAEIDTWLFLKKDLIQTPFHLTTTTDY